jgi:hypothetical protein
LKIEVGSAVKKFELELRAIRSDLGTALDAEASGPTKALAAKLEGRLHRALLEFGEQREGTHGQAWSMLVWSALRRLEHAAGYEDLEKIRVDLREAEGLLDQALADMKS